CTPDTNKSNAACAHLARAAALAHYNGLTPWGGTWGIIAEWDYGHNAFTAGNLFSGSGPSDAIGISSATPTNPGFVAWNKMVGGILNTQAVQEGADLMGHVDIPHTPFTAFGLLQWLQPNTRVDKDPLDFTRYDVGVQWTVNKYLRLAVDSQAIQYYHGQFTYDEGFPGLGGGSTNHPGPPVTAKTVAPTEFAVPRDTHGFFLQMEFRY